MHGLFAKTLFGVFIFLVISGAKMSTEGNGSDGSGKQPVTSIRNVFSSLFNRDRSNPADKPAVLIAFRELPKGEDPLPDTRGSNQEDVAGRNPSDVGKKDDAIEPELVQVTRVETYSDTENEEEDEASLHSHHGPKGDGNESRDESESECEVPMFRTHNLDRSYIENMLHTEKSRWKNHSRRTGAESNSGPEGTETSNSGNRKESDVYAGIDCSLPAASIISGPAGSEATVPDPAAASSLEHAEDSFRTVKGETKEGTAESPKDPETPEVSDQTASSPNEPPVDQNTSGGDHQHNTASKTPETNMATSDSSPPSSRGVTPPSPPSFQMPALFSGLRVLKKGAAGEDRDTTAEIKQREKDTDLALLSLKKSVNKAKMYPEQKTPSPTKKHPEAGKSAAKGPAANTSGDGQDADASGENVSESGGGVTGEKSPGTSDRRTTSDLAYETFRSIFDPRAAKKDKMDNVDLEAVKRKIKNEKENLKSIFERVSRTPSKEIKSPTEEKVRFPRLSSINKSGGFETAQQNRCPCLTSFHLFSFFPPQVEVTSPVDSEDRTPGRLQAVWPPPKPKDEEEKVGLKYTEAGKNLIL